MNIDKRIAIASSIIITAESIIQSLKQLPKKRIFLKTYNRRPMAKKKRAIILAKTAISTLIGAARIRSIIEQPIPKFKQGAVKIE